VGRAHLQRVWISNTGTPKATPNLFYRLRGKVLESRTLFALQHIAFQNEELFVKLYLMQPERAGFLNVHDSLLLRLMRRYPAPEGTALLVIAISTLLLLNVPAPDIVYKAF
jgi:hypothetical protein